MMQTKRPGSLGGVEPESPHHTIESAADSSCQQSKRSHNGGAGEEEVLV